MDRRTLITIVTCFLIFMGWQKLYIEPRMPKPSTAVTASQPEASAPQAATSATSLSGASASLDKASVNSATPTQVAFEEKSIPMGTGVAKVGNGPRIFTGWDLKSYKLGISAEAAAVDLKWVTHQEGEVEIAFDHPDYAYLSGVRGILKQTPLGTVWTYEDSKVKLTRELSSGEGQNFVNVKYSAEFKANKPAYAFLSLASHSPEKDPEEHDRQLVYWTNKSIERANVNDLKETKEVSTGIRWIGANSRYFLVALVPDTAGAEEPKGLVQPTGPRAGRVSLVYPVKANTLSVNFKTFFGPKELELLRTVDPTLDNTVDFGWFTLFAYPLLKTMKWIYGIFQNYGIAIILLTLFVKVLTYPLTYKSIKSMKEMAKIQPQLQKVREKYKDDREALNREMLSLMKNHGYNPMAGCLPILIQMPIFFALYRVLYSSIELYHAPFIFWIKDLSERDPFYVTPVLLTVTMYIQQKLTPTTATDPAQQKMMQFMPIMFGAFMLTLPSGLTVYMLVNALASILQQAILNKKFETGNVTATPARSR